MKEQDDFDPVERLRKAGLEVLTEFGELPYYDSVVCAGDPKSEADDHRGDDLSVCQAFIDMGSDFCVRVHGESMTGGHIYEGDYLLVRSQRVARHNDLVVVMLDGCTAVKSYFEDEHGEVWFVPANDKFMAHSVTEYSEVLIMGVVQKVINNSPCVPQSENARRVNEAKQLRDRVAEPLGVPSDEAIAHALAKVVDRIVSKRLWFVIFRVLVDVKRLPKQDFQGFHELLQSIMGPATPDLDLKDLSRMDAMSFRRPVSQWDPNYAPVGSARFRTYYRLAEDFMAELRVAMRLYP